MRFAVVDVETSGLSTRRHRLLQVAVVTVEDGQIVDEWQSKVRLRWPLQRVGPRKVHGLSRADLRGAPRLSEVMAEVAERVSGATLVAHNLGFDLEFLQRASQRSGVPLAPDGAICTLLLSRDGDPDRALRHGLSDVASRYGIVNERPHDALHDARTTALVLPYLLDEAGIDNTEQIARLADRQSAYLASRR